MKFSTFTVEGRRVQGYVSELFGYYRHTDGRVYVVDLGAEKSIICTHYASVAREIVEEAEKMKWNGEDKFLNLLRIKEAILRQ